MPLVIRKYKRLKSNRRFDYLPRYIRLTYLIPSLLELVDQKRLQFTCAVDISYFDKNIQTWLNEYIRGIFDLILETVITK